MLIDLPEALRARGLRKPHTSAQFFGMDPGPHDGVEQGTISKNFINRTEIVTASTTPRCAIEITCNQVNALRNHNGTKGLDDFLGNAFLLGVDVADVQGQHGKELLTTDCGTTK